MSPHKGECVRCGDSRYDLNYSEIPDSWNNKEKTKMILFAIIGGSLEVVYTATVIGMLIMCWAIYTVYTGGFSDL